MKTFITTLLTIIITIVITSDILAQNIPIFLPKWYTVDKDTTFKDKDLVYNGIPDIFKEDKINNIYTFSSTAQGYQLYKIDRKTGKKLWETGRNQSYGIEDKAYFPKDFFFRPDGNIEVFTTKGVEFPALLGFGSTMKCVYDAKTGKELFNFLSDKKGGSAVTLNYGAYVNQIVEKKDKSGYYFSDGRSGGKYISWIRTVDTNFVAKDTLLIELPLSDASKGMDIRLSPFHRINGTFYQMSGHFRSFDTTRIRSYFTKIDFQNKKYTVKDVSKYWFHGLDFINFTPIKDDFIVSVSADSAYSTLNGMKYNPNLLLAKVDTNGTLKWRNYLFPLQTLKKGYTAVVQDNKTDGYWVVLSSYYNVSNTYLYYMSKNGALKLIGELALPNKAYTFTGIVPTMLSNGDIVMGYRTQTEDVIHPIYGSNGTLYFERSQFEGFITKTEEIKLDEAQCLLYPNPTAQSVQLVLPEMVGFEYFLVDASGKTIKTEKVTPTNFHSIELGSISAGTYFLNITTENNQTFVKKIVKQ